VASTGPGPSGRNPSIRSSGARRFHRARCYRRSSLATPNDAVCTTGGFGAFILLSFCASRHSLPLMTFLHDTPPWARVDPPGHPDVPMQRHMGLTDNLSAKGAAASPLRASWEPANQSRRHMLIRTFSVRWICVGRRVYISSPLSLFGQVTHFPSTCF